MLSHELDKRLGKAIDYAHRLKHEFITLEHFLFCLCEAPQIMDLLEKFDLTPTDIKNELEIYIKKNPALTAEQINLLDPDWKPSLTISVHRVFESAALQMQNAGRNMVSESTVFISLFDEKKSYACHVLEKLGLTQFDVISAVSHDLSASLGTNEEKDSSSITGKDEQKKTSALDEFAMNLNQYAESGRKDPLIGRTDVLTKMIQSLARKQKNNPLIVGDSGVGKTAIVEGLAERIVQGEVPEFLKNKIIYSVDLGSLLAGAKYRGDFEGRLKKIVKEAQERKNIILFFDEIHTLVGAGSTSGGSMDAANLLKPALAKGEISCIGATTFSEYRQHFEKDRAMNRRFQKIDLAECSPDETLEILKGIKSKYESFHQLQIQEESLQSCMELSVKFIASSQLPDKAIDLLDEVCSYVKLKPADGSKKVVTPDDVIRVVSQISGVPNTQMELDESKTLKDLDLRLKAHVFGQDEAIETLVRAIKFARSGLENKDKPWGSFLFAGPTGVGKTEVCRQLARLLGIHFQRFDMSEYMEKHTVARLVGAPPGYVGFDQGGQLTEAITKNPYSLILLDEIEKAHSDIYNILLQVMDAGRLTDSQGRLVNFKNCLLVMTTNAGAQDVARGQIGLTPNQGRSTISAEAIKKTFSPEFINRLNHTVYFNSLTLDLIKQIVEKNLVELKKSLAAKNVNMIYSEAVVDHLAQVSYNPIYGARPVARKIDQLIKASLVDEILFGKLKTGGEFKIDFIDSKFEFEFNKSAPASTNPGTGKANSKNKKKVTIP
jgi:ATP-dependent Clp protease ATP-binding subunit ClpA